MTDDEGESPDLGAYHCWLYKVAAEFLPGGPHDTDIDDLVQEGRIAIWKAYQVYDECKGTLAPWLTNAARMRIRHRQSSRALAFQAAAAPWSSPS